MNEDNLELAYLMNKKSKQRIMLSKLAKGSLFLYKRQVWELLDTPAEGVYYVNVQRLSTCKDGTIGIAENDFFSTQILVEPCI